MHLPVLVIHAYNAKLDSLIARSLYGIFRKIKFRLYYIKLYVTNKNKHESHIVIPYCVEVY